MATRTQGSPWREPEEHVLFGDVFAAPWLLDLFVREDAALIGGGKVPASLAPKLGKWMGVQLPAAAIEIYSQAFTAKEQDRYAVAHASFLPDASTHYAILVSDSCLAATSLVQGREKRSVSGRLLFAPVRGIPDAEWDALEGGADFGRFRLPPSDELPERAVVEVRQCFMVDAVHVKRHINTRVCACGPELAKELEAQWNAYAARRGPIAYERNALKLAYLLAGGQQSAPADEAIADTVAATLDCAWALEGADLENVSEAEEAVRLGGEQAEAHMPQLRGDLIARLRELSKLAETSADALASTGATSNKP